MTMVLDLNGFSFARKDTSLSQDIQLLIEEQQGLFEAFLFRTGIDVNIS